MARKNQTPPASFEQAVEELEQILAHIEAGQLGLEETLLKYERGNFLIEHCRQVLSAAEKQVELISKGPNGTLNIKPLESEAQEQSDT